MAAIGLNIAADGRHDGPSIRALGATWARVAARRDIDLRGRLADYRDHGIRTLLVLDRRSIEAYGPVDSASLPASATAALAAYRQRYDDLVAAWEVGNEPDQASDSSWTLPVEDLVALGRTARAWLPGRLLVCGGLASGQPEYLVGQDIGWCDVIAVHPYVKDAPNPADLEDLPDVNELVDQYRALGKQVWITEWGWWGSDEQRGGEEVDDMVSWAAHTSDVAVFCYFCADDAMVAPFGLVRADGTPKPAAARFTARAGGALSVPLPTPPGPPPVEPQAPLDSVFAALWRAHLPHLDYTPFAAESVPAFQKYWRAHPEIGSPVTGEVDLGDGTRGMAFANGVYQWTGGETVERLP